jgi:hypothetical protein
MTWVVTAWGVYALGWFTCTSVFVRVAPKNNSPEDLALKAIASLFWPVIAPITAAYLVGKPRARRNPLDDLERLEKEAGIR